jgi:heme transport system substrate-binding protein
MCPFRHSGARFLLTALAMVFVLTPALLAPALADAISVRDASGRRVEVSDPTRIISIGGAVTEILYALGRERQVIAVDSTSSYPPRALNDKPNVGYMRQLSPEGVLGLAPSVVLAAEGAGPPEAIAVLRAASVPLVFVPDHFTGEGIVEKVNLVAAVAGAAAAGECLAQAVKADLVALANLRQHVGEPRRVLFLLSFLNGRPMVAGRATAADGIIRLAGAVNAMTEHEGYKLVGDEAIVAAQPDVVLVMQRSQHNLSAQEVFAHSAFALTPAAARTSLVSMNGLYLLGFGPRTALAGRDLAAALYPALSADKLPSEQGAAPGESCRK